MFGLPSVDIVISSGGNGMVQTHTDWRFGLSRRSIFFRAVLLEISSVDNWLFEQTSFSKEVLSARFRSAIRFPSNPISVSEKHPETSRLEIWFILQRRCFKEVLFAICNSSNFEYLRKRIGQTIQTGFALSSDIWVTNLINEIALADLTEINKNGQMDIRIAEMNTFGKG